MVTREQRIRSRPDEEGITIGKTHAFQSPLAVFARALLNWKGAMVLVCVSWLAFLLAP